MVVLIDADSLIYICAWVNRDNPSEDDMRRSLDTYLSDIVTLTQADTYIGVFSDRRNFRHRLYNYAPYKGNRPEKSECVVQWEEFIKNHYTNKHGFITLTDLEADDVVAATAILLRKKNEHAIMASPDKDMKQVWGLHFNYRPPKIGDESVEARPVGTVTQIGEQDANFAFWMQMLTGDSTDNIKGVPGLGEVKAKALLNAALDPMMYESIVRCAYVKYFGTHYGRIIYEETFYTVKLMCPEHLLWNDYQEQLLQVLAQERKLNTAVGFFDV